MKLSFFSVLLLVLGHWSSAFAQTADVRVELTTPYDTVGVDEVFEISLTAHNTRFVGQFSMPRVEGLEWLPGHGTHQHMQTVNGVSTSAIGYRYRARATQLGVVILPPMEVETEAGLFISEERVVVVVPEPPARPSLREQYLGNSIFGGDPFHATPSPFGDDMDERMENLRREMLELQERKLEELETMPERRGRSRIPPKPTQKKRKTYRI